MSGRFLGLAATCLAVALSAGCSEPVDPMSPSARVSAGVVQAQSRCYGLIHHDTLEFGDCVRTLAIDEQLSDELRLGIEYFGWVGAMNSARLGMPGADDTAREFLVRFRGVQQKLNVDDATLCAAVPGDCVARIARLLQMERESAASSLSNRR